MVYTKTNWVNDTTPINATNLNKIEDQLEALTNAIYPVGSIYLTINNTDPSTIFGGTWEQITSDAYLKIVSSNAGNLGGTSSDHKIPLTSIPSHNHSAGTANAFSVYNGNIGFANGNYYTRGTQNNTANAGGGQAYYPYYLGVYVWKRTA